MRWLILIAIVAAGWWWLCRRRADGVAGAPAVPSPRDLLREGRKRGGLVIPLGRLPTAEFSPGGASMTGLGGGADCGCR